MKKSTVILCLCSLFIVLTAFQCDDDDMVSFSCDDTISQLNQMKTDIEVLVDQSICGDAFECRYIAFGSKPCGGPWSYLVYSTSIDTLQLANLVNEYNQLESDFNQECERFSDCTIENPPVSLECQDNKCIAIY